MFFSKVKQRNLYQPYNNSEEKKLLLMCVLICVSSANGDFKAEIKIKRFFSFCLIPLLRGRNLEFERRFTKKR